MHRVLTVCLGNICRSPAAEAAIRSAAADAGMSIEVDSAGTGAYHLGEPPHPRSRAAGAEVGLNIAGRARQITLADFDHFDLILAMDHTNLADLIALAPDEEARAKVRLFRSFDAHADAIDVPDPYYGTEDDYRTMIELIVPAARGVVEQLRSSRGEIDTNEPL
jgi:protein-tyrosine phosphatase